MHLFPDLTPEEYGQVEMSANVENSAVVNKEPTERTAQTQVSVRKEPLESVKKEPTERTTQTRVSVKNEPLESVCKEPRSQNMSGCFEKEQGGEDMSQRVENCGVGGSRKKGKLVCNLCGNLFASLGSLKNHGGMHAEKAFVCEVCGRAFRQKKDLLCHFQRKRPCVPKKF